MKGKLVFKNLDTKRRLALMEARVQLMRAGVTFDEVTSTDGASCEWLIDDNTEGMELDVNIFDDCTCPCMNCDKVCCPHRQNPYYQPYVSPYIQTPYPNTTGDAWTKINTTNTGG